MRKQAHARKNNIHPAAASMLRMAPDEHLTLVLVRHGQAGGNGTREGFLGHALSSAGETQAVRVADRLAPVPLDHIYCSDMARAWQTADAIRRHHVHTPFDVTSDLREISSFQVPGRPPARTLEERSRMHEERARVAAFARRLRAAHGPGQRVAIIGHNGVNGMLLAALSDVPWRKNYRWHACHTAVTLVSIMANDARAVVRLVGCTRHLPPGLITHDNLRGQI